MDDKKIAKFPAATGSFAEGLRRSSTSNPDVKPIEARVTLTQPLRATRQFIGLTGSGHRLILDDSAGGTGAKPIELVAVGLAGCTAFDVITILRNKKQQRVTAYEVSVSATQAQRAPQVFVNIRIHHTVTGYSVDPAAVADAIRLSEEKYCSVRAMLAHTAVITTTYEVLEEKLAETPELVGSTMAGVPVAVE
jgi:putative redox protein